MLSVKPWKADAALRLLLSVFVCVYAGSLLGSVRQYAVTGGSPRAWVVYSLALVSFACLVATLLLLGAQVISEYERLFHHAGKPPRGELVRR